MTKRLAMTELQFEQALVDLAHEFGWRAAGFRPARTDHGWRTAVKYDAEGWPDLTLTHRRGVVIFAELKVGRNITSQQQLAWGDHLTDVEIEADKRTTEGDPSPIRYRLWHPRHSHQIITELSFGRAREWHLPQ